MPLPTKAHRDRATRCIVAAVLAVLLAGVAPRPAAALRGDCAQPVTNGALPSATDCLFILRVAVGSSTCDPTCVCAPKGTVPTTATDSLICLKMAVGQSVSLNCPCQTTTTTLPPGANIVIVNLDGSNEGFNDRSARTPVGGNSGTTLGQQRLNVFEYVAGLWGQVIASPVTIRVEATFDPLTCDSQSAVLGAAGAASYMRDFPQAPLSNTWYPAALANKLAGFDQATSSPDIIAQFNSAIGTTCSFPQVWYYGFDGDPPSGQIDLASVVLHELGHGLGFATIVNLSTGERPGGFNDAFMRWLEDHSTAKTFPVMGNSERAFASKDTGDLHWKGPAVVAASDRLTSGVHAASGHVRMYAPNPLELGSSVSHWDTALFPDEIMEPRYVGPIHDVGLMRELFDDLGWNTIP